MKVRELRSRLDDVSPDTDVVMVVGAEYVKIDESQQADTQTLVLHIEKARSTGLFGQPVLALHPFQLVD